MMLGTDGKRERSVGAIRRLAELRAGPTSPRAQRALAVATVVALALAAWFAIRSLPETGGIIWWPLVVVALLGVPITMLLNGAEYALAGRMVDQSVTLEDAVKVSLQGTAANLLPIPGAAVVRVRYLMGDGAALGRSSAATVVVGITWLGTSLIMAALAMAGSPAWLRTSMLAGGAVALVLAGWILRRVADRRRPTLAAMLLATEVAAVVVQGARYLLVLTALSVDATAAQAIALAVSVAAGAAIGLLPGGLGVRELIAGAMGPVVGLDAATGLLTAIIDRVVGLVVLVPAAVVSGLVQERRLQGGVSVDGPGE